jgi:amino acid adenylation domain-containing protein
MNLPSALLQDYLSRSAERLPGKIALVAGREQWTYAELERHSDAVAYVLRRGGVRRGDRVIVLAENGSTPAIAFWGILKADGVACIVSPETAPHKLAYYLGDTRAAALVVDKHLDSAFVPIIGNAPHLVTVLAAGNPPEATMPELQTFADALTALPADFRPPRHNLDIDLAAIVYTSGSTGEPKGVMLTHRNMLAASSAINHYLGHLEDDVILGALPFSFDYGLYQLILAAAVGARLVVERSFALLLQVLARAQREAVTVFPCVPSVVALMERLPVRELLHVRSVTSTGDVLAERHVATLRRVFPAAQIFSMYGVTECKRCSYLPPEDLERKPGSVGLPIPGTEFWLVDEQDQRLGPNQVGELVIRGATVMRGYWEKPEATARRLRPGVLPGELVLYTGDLCRLDEDGYLYFVARMDDVIKSRGEKVALREVEAVLLVLPGVREAAVIALPDAVWGHVLKAFVVAENSAVLDIDHLLAGCRLRLTPAQVPKAIFVVAELPRTRNGKIDKAALRTPLD